MLSQQSSRQIILGISAILLSGVIILGSLSFTLLERKPAIALLGESTKLPQDTAVKITVIPGEPTFTSPPSTPTPTFSPPVSCPPPVGWVAYDVQPDDTLNSLADLLGYEVELIADGNCLTPGSSIQNGMILYLPSSASATPISGTATATAKSSSGRAARRTVCPPLQCGRPAGWTTYVVRYGDTLSKIAQQFYTTVAQLQRANCLTSATIRAGRIIYVPNRATRTPFPTITPRPTITPTIIVPTTNIPTTFVPTTLVPSIPPTTLIPTTAVPTTAHPTSALPTTPVPTTQIPTATVPTSPPPPTSVPTTQVPTTVPPTQPPPTTSLPPPTTAAPTTEPPPTTDP